VAVTGRGLLARGQAGVPDPAFAGRRQVARRDLFVIFHPVSFLSVVLPLFMLLPVPVLTFSFVLVLMMTLMPVLVFVHLDHSVFSDHQYPSLATAG